MYIAVATPIIDPWIFYKIHVIATLRNIMIAISIFGGMSILMSLVIMSDTHDDKEFDSFKRVVKIAGIFLIFGLLGVTLLPTKKTMYEMLIAKNVTYERLNISKEAIAKFHDTIKKDVLDIIKQIENKNKK